MKIAPSGRDQRIHRTAVAKTLFSSGTQKGQTPVARISDQSKLMTLSRRAKANLVIAYEAGSIIAAAAAVATGAFLGLAPLIGLGIAAFAIAFIAIPYIEKHLKLRP